ncbi:hypothetical protein AVEN_101165-1 [Araneus ventricosus]|uniref:Uncharacterized protein n=1 Tax=Araneus ventricosus TaxID=182803 RepID=A0A4Y2DCJ9_ARAVE|nr:hypothetical protein AVEN_101165-1 [Araneus ventricosus]
MKMKILIGCLSLLGIFEMGLSEETGAAFLECINGEVCQAENGLARGVYCIELLSEMDVQVFIELLNDYYPGTTELHPLVEKVCDNFERGAEAIRYWFVERERKNLTHNAEQVQADINARVRHFLNIFQILLFVDAYASFHSPRSFAPMRVQS